MDDNSAKIKEALAFLKNDKFNESLLCLESALPKTFDIDLLIYYVNVKKSIWLTRDYIVQGDCECALVEIYRGFYFYGCYETYLGNEYYENIHDDYIKLMNFKSFCCNMMNNHVGANDASSIVLKMDDSNPWGLTDKLFALLFLKRQHDRNSYLDKLLQVDDDFSQTYLYKIMSLLSEKDIEIDIGEVHCVDEHFIECPNNHKELVEYYDYVFGLKDKYVELLYKKANLLYDLEKFDDSFILFEKIVNIDSQNIKGYLGMSHSLFQMKRYNESLYYYNLALTIDDSCVEVDFYNDLFKKAENEDV